MTIYWERCNICGRHLPTKTCWLHPELNVCPHCCVLCPERGICPNPVWYPEAKLEAVKLVEHRAVVETGARVEARVERPAAVEARAAPPLSEERRREEERREKLRKLEELLKRLGGG